MDATEMLVELRRNIGLLQDEPTAKSWEERAVLILDAIDALDRHLSSGGTKPKQWTEGSYVPPPDYV